MRILKTRIGVVCIAAMLFAVSATIASGSTIYSDRAAWEAQVTGLTIFDFNGLAGNLYQTLTLGDVTFDVPGYPDGSALWVSTPGSYAPFDIALVGNHWLTTIQGSFASDVTAVGADVANLSVNDVITISVEINGTWFQWNVNYTYPTPFFWGIIADPGESIEAITFSPNTSNWVAIDNFSYGAATGVPEPASIALLGSSILGLAGLLRRKLM
jgi:hypothetical protein